MLSYDGQLVESGQWRWGWFSLTYLFTTEGFVPFNTVFFFAVTGQAEVPVWGAWMSVGSVWEPRLTVDGGVGLGRGVGTRMYLV